MLACRACYKQDARGAQCRHGRDGKIEELARLSRARVTCAFAFQIHVSVKPADAAALRAPSAPAAQPAGSHSPCAFAVCLVCPRPFVCTCLLLLPRSLASRHDRLQRVSPIRCMLQAPPTAHVPQQPTTREQRARACIHPCTHARSPVTLMLASTRPAAPPDPPCLPLPPRLCETHRKLGLAAPVERGNALTYLRHLLDHYSTHECDSARLNAHPNPCVGPATHLDVCRTAGKQIGRSDLTGAKEPPRPELSIRYTLRASTTQA